MTKSTERHRLSLIIATLGPSTDDSKELVTMITAGIARQWTDGVDIARVLHSDGESISKDRVDAFREACEKRKLTTFIYLDTDTEDFTNLTQYIEFANKINPKYCVIPKKFGLENIKHAKEIVNPDIQIGVRICENQDSDDIADYFNLTDFAMIELDSKVIVDKKIVNLARENNCEPMYLAKMPTLMKGQVQSRDENFEIGHTLEEGFDVVALYQETSHGPYAARSVKCIDEIAVESEKLRVNPFQDLLDKLLSFFKKS